MFVIGFKHESELINTISNNNNETNFNFFRITYALNPF